MDTLGLGMHLQGSQWQGCCGAHAPGLSLLKPISPQPLFPHEREQSVLEGTWKSPHFKLFILNQELGNQQQQVVLGVQMRNQGSVLLSMSQISPAVMDELWNWWQKGATKAESEFASPEAYQQLR